MEDFSGLCEGDTAGMAFEEWSSDGFFKCGDLSAESGLGNEEFFGGAVDLSVLGYCDEKFELIEVHVG